MPQAITAITAALLGAGLVRRLGEKRIFLLGFFADLISMALLVASQFVMHERTDRLSDSVDRDRIHGRRLRLTVPAINTLRRRVFQKKSIERC